MKAKAKAIPKAKLRARAATNSIINHSTSTSHSYEAQKKRKELRMMRRMRNAFSEFYTLFSGICNFLSLLILLHVYLKPEL